MKLDELKALADLMPKVQRLELRASTEAWDALRAGAPRAGRFSSLLGVPVVLADAMPPWTARLWDCDKQEWVGAIVNLAEPRHG